MRAHRGVWYDGDAMFNRGSQTLTPEQWTVTAEKLMEWGNLVFIGLVIAQVIPGGTRFRSAAGTIGVVCFAVAYAVAYLIMKYTKGGGAKR